MLMLAALASLCLLGPALALSEAEPLQIGVYYESLCPDCKHFVVDQVNKTYAAVPEAVSFTLVPWGKANASAHGDRVTCQHGEEECWGNRLQWCVAERAASAAAAVRVCACLMDVQKTLRKDGAACLQAAGQSWDEAVRCAESQRAWDQALEFGRQTAALEPPLTFVPTVTVGGSQGTPEQQKQMVDDLLGYVCDAWKEKTGDKPDACP